jgi:hypothetical protein
MVESLLILGVLKGSGETWGADRALLLFLHILGFCASRLGRRLYSHLPKTFASARRPLRSRNVFPLIRLSNRSFFFAFSLLRTTQITHSTPGPVVVSLLSFYAFWTPPRIRRVWPRFRLFNVKKATETSLLDSDPRFRYCIASRQSRRWLHTWCTYN